MTCSVQHVLKRRLIIEWPFTPLYLQYDFLHINDNLCMELCRSWLVFALQEYMQLLQLHKENVTNLDACVAQVSAYIHKSFSQNELIEIVAIILFLKLQEINLEIVFQTLWLRPHTFQRLYSSFSMLMTNSSAMRNFIAYYILLIVQQPRTSHLQRMIFYWRLFIPLEN